MTGQARLASFLFIAAATASPQGRGGGRAQATTQTPNSSASSAVVVNRDLVRENYTKFDYRIRMRDGVKLFTSVYVPKDVFSDGIKYPMLMQRTGYSIGPYGIDQYPNNLGPSELFAREKFIFVYQDVRGRYMSEGNYVTIRPQKAVKNG